MSTLEHRVMFWIMVGIIFVLTLPEPYFLPAALVVSLLALIVAGIGAYKAWKNRNKPWRG